MAASDWPVSVDSRPDTLGVLGGMGPLATVDLLSKLIAVTPAKQDPDHIPVVVSSEPHIPRRVAAFLDPENNEAPAAAIRARRDRLIDAGARCLVMPCNTAHYWYDDVAGDCPVPFIHIVHATADELVRRGVSSGTLGLLGTEATLAGKLFETPLVERGYRCIAADDAVMQEFARPGIDMVKQNRIADAEPLLRRAVEAMLDQGAETVVLGCTEIPAGLPMQDSWARKHCVDPTEALAQSAYAWARDVRAAEGL